MMIGFQDVLVLSWNIWGAQNKNAKLHVVDLIRKYNPTFIAIIETHVSYEKTHSFWNRSGYTKVVVIEAQGHAGGLWLFK